MLQERFEGGIRLYYDSNLGLWLNEPALLKIASLIFLEKVFFKENQMRHFVYY